MNDFQEKLKEKMEMDEYAHAVYKLTKSFPREELYGLTSQLRRASLSVALNFIEGYARIKNKVNKNFLEISYGSLKESRYLIEFSFKESYISSLEHKKLIDLSEEIGAMLWSIMKSNNA